MKKMTLYLDTAQTHLSAGAHTVGGKVNLWTRRKEGHFRDVLKPPHLSRCEYGVISAEGGKEPQGAGDSCQTDQVPR